MKKLFKFLILVFACVLLVGGIFSVTKKEKDEQSSEQVSVEEGDSTDIPNASDSPSEEQGDGAEWEEWQEESMLVVPDNE